MHYLRPALLIGDLSRIARQTQTSESESNSDVEKIFKGNSWTGSFDLSKIANPFQKCQESQKNNHSCDRSSIQRFITLSF